MTLIHGVLQTAPRERIDGCALTFRTASSDPTLGAQRLTRGGSISGHVRDKSGDAVEGAEVTAVPIAPSGVGKVPARTQRAKSDKHGFFQITALAEGTYHVEAKSAGKANADGGMVDVKDGEEHALARPLVHLGLQAVDVFVTPPVDRGGHPWSLSLFRRLSPTSRTLKKVAGGEAGTNGFWHAEGLEPGEYTLSVQTADGAVRKRDTIQLDQGTQTVSIALDDVAIRGTVRSGSAKLATHLTFVDDEGARVHADSDEDGEYELSLPHEGTWHVEVSSEKPRIRLFRLFKAEVKRSDDQEFVRVDVELPAGRVAGTVTDGEGKLVDAIVVVHRNGEMVAQTFAEGGTFDVAGIREGPAQIDARTPNTQSELQPIDVTEKTEVDLVIRKRVTMRGVVVSREGNAIAGAILRAVSSGFDGVVNTVTGTSGKFEMSIPSADRAITVIVLAPRHPIRIIQVPAGYSLAEPVRVVAAPIGGRLRIRFPGAPPWPLVTKSGDAVPLSLLLYPPDASGYPGGLTEDGFAGDVEPGDYTVCIQRPERRCSTRVVAPGSDVLMEFGSGKKP